MTDKEPYSADDIKRRKRKFDNSYEEKIHILEDEIIKLRELLPDEMSKKKGKKQQQKETTLQLEIETKDQEMRGLKTRMRYLRIENIDLQKELREKINKQESLIRRFQNNSTQGIDKFRAPIRELKSDQCYILVAEDIKRIFIWKGAKCHVRKRFISSRVAMELQKELVDDSNLRCKIVSVDEGNEPEEFNTWIMENLKELRDSFDRRDDDDNDPLFSPFFPFYF